MKSIDLKKFTKEPILDQTLINANSKMIREKGYLTDQGEAFEGLNCNCIGAPIRNAAGTVIATNNLMDILSRTSAEKLFQYAVT